MATLIPVTKVTPSPKQPRTVFDPVSLAELAESIKENDVIQPIVVEDNGDGSYTLVGGERRLRACKLLGRDTIPAEIRARSNHGGRELLVMGLVENIQREDMNPMDEAEAYQQLRDAYRMTWADISIKTGKNSSQIQQRALLTKLDPEIKELIRAGKFPGAPEIARALLAIPNSEARIKLAKAASQRGMTWKQIKAAANKFAEAYASTQAESQDGANIKASPAMRLAHKQTRGSFDDNTPPSKDWDVLARQGIVPPWKTLANATKGTCEACSLVSMASDATCRDCPAVELVKRMVNHE